MLEIKTIIIQGIEYDLTPKNKEPEKKKGRGKPDWGQTYFSLDGEYKWVDDGYDNKCYALGFVFKTETERDDYAARQKAIVCVNDRIDELNDGWEPDWSDYYMEKYQIYYDFNNNQFHRYYYLATTYSCVLKYIKSEQLVRQIISEMKSELDLIFKK